MTVMDKPMKKEPSTETSGTKMETKMDLEIPIAPFCPALSPPDMYQTPMTATTTTIFSTLAPLSCATVLMMIVMDKPMKKEPPMPPFGMQTTTAMDMERERTWFPPVRSPAATL